MILAFKGLRNLGWAALVFLVAILLYPLSLSVAALRSELYQTEAQILSTRRSIHYLEVEFATRASMQQLQAWNELDYGYTAPTADQYLDGERALANLGRGRDALDEPVRVAQITINPGVKPTGVIGSPFGDSVGMGTANAREARPAARIATSDTLPERIAVPAASPASASAVPRPAAQRPTDSTDRREAFAARMELSLTTQPDAREEIDRP